MSNNPQMKDDDSARDQAKAQLAGVIEMVRAYESAQDDEEEKAREAIEQDALSVDVRTSWQSVGDKPQYEEYRILLCTGGPAVQIAGDLNVHGEPHTARLQYQDWGTPWTDLPLTGDDDEEALLKYAQCFYFGE